MTTEKTGNETVEPQFLSHVYRTADVPPQGVDGRLEATPGQRAVIADALDLLALDALSFSYRLRRSGRDGFTLKGTLEARVKQSCIVTLDSLESEISENIDLCFLPPDEIARLEQENAPGESDIDPEGPEPIMDGAIDIGQLVYETLASGLEPYPRKPGAVFKWETEMDKDDKGADHPFSALKSFRPAQK